MTEKSYEQLVAEAKARIAEVTPREAIAIREREPGAVFLDVREPPEWNLFRIPGAVWVPLGQVEGTVAEKVPRDAKVIVYCRSGNRSALAADSMRRMGYADVASLAQGIVGWSDQGGELEQ